MKIIHLLFGFFLLGLGESALAQIQPNFEETVGFSIPKKVYFTGEKIWLSIDVAISSGPTPSRVVYAELWNRHSESVAMAKIPLQDGLAFNYLEIPSGLPSDHYLLRVFTRVSPYQNPDIGLVQEFVTVFNPHIPPKVVESRRDLSRDEVSSEFLEFSHSSLSPGEQLSVNYTGSDSLIELSVAVANLFLDSPRQHLSKNLYDKLEAKALVPEFFGHIIEAKAQMDGRDSSGSGLYFLSLHGKKSALFTERKNGEGNLLIDAGGFRHWEYLIAQRDENQPLGDFEIVAPSPPTKFRQDFSFPTLEISPSDSTFLRELLLGSQIGGYFAQEFEQNDIPVVEGFVPDRTFLLDDYTRFEDVETHIKEYVPEVLVRTRDRHKEIRVLNALQERSFEESPLVLLDAMPVFEPDRLLRFSSAKLKQLEIYSRPFFLNDARFAGVVSFSSFDNDFGGFPLSEEAVFIPYPGLQPPVMERERLFEVPRENSKETDWRTVLYWSEVFGRRASVSGVSITTSWVKGRYLVEATVMDSSGKIKYEKAWFEVK